MPSSRELLNDPDFQGVLVARGDRDIREIFRQPSVVFDRGGVDEFWTILTNSPRKEFFIEKIKSGETIPINADIMGDIADVHSIFHAYLAESSADILTIPTVVNVSGRIAPVGKHKLPILIPGFFVHKTSYKDGKSTSHRGEGVKMVRIAEVDMQEHLPKSLYEFLQPFVVPPDDYVRDIRVYIVGGKPVAGLVRRAKKPLLSENLRGELLPTEEQYPSAKAPGPQEILSGKLRAIVFRHAEIICDILDRKAKSRKRPFSQHSTLGFGSVDFLLDANGTPLPVDFDVSPSMTVFEGLDKEVGYHLAKILTDLSHEGNSERRIVVIGSETDILAKTVIEQLKGLIGFDRLLIQKSIMEKTTGSEQPFRKTVREGRNEPCPCGSGKKYKKCHWLD